MTDERPLCTRTTKNGEPCRGFALPGRDVCFSHSRTVEQATEQARKGQVAMTRKRRAAKLNVNALRREVTEVKALDVAAKLLSGVPLEAPESARNYPGRRHVTHEGTVIGLHILLTLTGPHLSPSAARSALEEAVPPGLRPSYVPPVEDVYTAARAEWRKASMLYREATGLSVSDYPPNLIAPWESAYEVTKNEPLPRFEGWQVGPLGDSPTHVLARSPEGEELIVRRAEVEGAFAAIG
jgi:hypothetical protein